PGVEGAFRLLPVDYQNNTLSVEWAGTTKSWQPSGVYFTDASLGNTLGIEPLLGGFSAMQEPMNMMLTESTANALLGSEWQLGSTISLSNNIITQDFQLVGVLPDLPGNTTFNFTVLLSYPSIGQAEFGVGEENSWAYPLNRFYVKSSQPAASLVTTIEQNILAREAVYQTEGETWEAKVLSLADNNLQYWTETGSLNSTALNTVYGLSFLGLLILVLAWTNFINLATARAMERAREVGVRKVMGSTKHQLRFQFTAEALLMNVFAAMLAVTLLQLGLPAFRELTGLTQLSPPSHLGFWWIALVVLVTGSLLSGAYPALVMAAYQPIQVLKGKLSAKTSGQSLRKGLVLFQFVASISMITASLVIYRQLSYMQNQDLGLAIDNKIVLDAPPQKVSSPGENENTINAFLDEMEKLAVVEKVTTSSFAPGEEVGWKAEIKRMEQEIDESIKVGMIACDAGFAEAYQLELVAGRFYNPTDDTFRAGDFVINEKGVEALGFASAEEAIGQELTGGYMFSKLTIIGVVKDFHNESLRERIEPTGFALSVWSNYYSVVFNFGDQTGAEDRMRVIHSGITQLQGLWERFFPDTPFNYTFLDEKYAAQYQAERDLSKIISLFTFISITLAILGLLGLSSYTVIQRTKEMGIRKVLGASSWSVWQTMVRQYFVVIAAAGVVALPLSYLGLSQWLMMFPYRSGLAWWIFAVPVIVILFAALITVGTLIARATRRNPIDSLRYE
ncbi:MAG: FtsX-like permease family protein, partial [Bacteroidota bacterium]